jgi:hypothetical protein
MEQTPEEFVLKVTAPLPDPPTALREIVDPTVVVDGFPETLNGACADRFEELNTKLTKEEATPA